MAGRKAPRVEYMQPETLIAFAEAYILTNGNASAALRRIDPKADEKYPRVYSTAKRMVDTEICQNALARIRSRGDQALSAVLDRYGITAERAAEELARLAFTQMRQVVNLYTAVDPETKKPRQHLDIRDFDKIDEDAHRAIVKIKRSASGAVEIELADKRAAIMDLARLKGWIVDKPDPNAGQQVNLIIQR